MVYLIDVWLKKGRFFRRSVSTFLQMVFGGTLALISLKLCLFSLQRSWSFLAYCMGYFSSLFLLIKGGYIRLLFWFAFSDLTKICVFFQLDITVKPLSTDTRLKQTPHYYGHFTFSPGERKPLYFLFKLFNTDTFNAPVSINGV